MRRFCFPPAYCILILAVFATGVSAMDVPQDVIARLVREADRFSEMANRIVATETLHQAVAGVGSHDIVSEYGYVRLPSGFREIRQVLSVDRKPVKHEKKLDSLALAAAADDDKQREKLLEAFEKHGLHGVATDFGQTILLFAHGNASKFEFSQGQLATFNKIRIFAFHFQQLDGAESLTIYNGREPVKQKLRGQIWVRAQDGLPLRIIFESNHTEGDERVKDTGIVDYGLQGMGVLVPIRVIHEQFRDGKPFAEDRFSYTDYHEVPSP